MPAMKASRVWQFGRWDDSNDNDNTQMIMGAHAGQELRRIVTYSSAQTTLLLILRAILLRISSVRHKYRESCYPARIKLATFSAQELMVLG